MKIIELQAENIKRIKAIEIKPMTNMVILEGKNEQGKTSVMDCIYYGLGGNKSIPDEAVRHGEDKAQIRINLEEYIVTKKWNKSGNITLKVENKDGTKVTSPQKMLDDLIGDLSFDPMSFCNLKKEKRLEILKKVAKINFNDLNDRHEKAFQERTFINRKVKELENQLTPFKFIENPGVIEDISNIQTKRTIGENKNNEYAQLERDIVGNKRYLEQLRGNIDRLRKELLGYEKEEEQARKNVETSEDALIMADKIDLTFFDEKIAAHSQNVVKKEKWKNGQEIKKSLAKATYDSEKLSSELDSVKKEKEARINNAEMPIEGLNFSDGDISFNGVEFSEISSSQKIKVSMAMAMALNPKLKIIRILNGSLLDDDAMKAVKEIAEKNDFQIWMECVSNVKSGNAIYIEDGEVK